MNSASVVPPATVGPSSMVSNCSMPSSSSSSSSSCSLHLFNVIHNVQEAHLNLLLAASRGDKEAKRSLDAFDPSSHQGYQAWYQDFSRVQRHAQDEWTVGHRQGREEGRREGLKEGRQQGLEEGRRKGLEEGRRRGLEEGRKEGYAEGFASGWTIASGSRRP